MNRWNCLVILPRARAHDDLLDRFLQSCILTQVDLFSRLCRTIIIYQFKAFTHVYWLFHDKKSIVFVPKGIYFAATSVFGRWQVSVVISDGHFNLCATLLIQCSVTISHRFAKFKVNKILAFLAISALSTYAPYYRSWRSGDILSIWFKLLMKTPKKASMNWLRSDCLSLPQVWLLSCSLKYDRNSNSRP